ncbi:MAG: hypothetical protein KJS98_14165, partial [Nitrospirae bacterium]|nr:hypothetical protein [Nitrospirota bacterium]
TGLPLFISCQKNCSYQITKVRFYQLHFSFSHTVELAFNTHGQVSRFSIMGHSSATAFRASCIPALSVPFLRSHLAL